MRKARDSSGTSCLLLMAIILIVVSGGSSPAWSWFHGDCEGNLQREIERNGEVLVSMGTTIHVVPDPCTVRNGERRAFRRHAYTLLPHGERIVALRAITATGENDWRSRMLAVTEHGVWGFVLTEENLGANKFLELDRLLVESRNKLLVIVQENHQSFLVADEGVLSFPGQQITYWPSRGSRYVFEKSKGEDHLVSFLSKTSALNQLRDVVNVPELNQDTRELASSLIERISGRRDDEAWRNIRVVIKSAMSTTINPPGEIRNPLHITNEVNSLLKAYRKNLSFYMSGYEKPMLVKACNQSLQLVTSATNELSYEVRAGVSIPFLEVFELGAAAAAKRAKSSRSQLKEEIPIGYRLELYGYKKTNQSKLQLLRYARFTRCNGENDYYTFMNKDEELPLKREFVARLLGESNTSLETMHAEYETWRGKIEVECIGDFVRIRNAFRAETELNSDEVALLLSFIVQPKNPENVGDCHRDAELQVDGIQLN